MRDARILLGALVLLLILGWAFEDMGDRRATNRERKQSQETADSLTALIRSRDLAVATLEAEKMAHDSTHARNVSNLEGRVSLYRDITEGRPRGPEPIPSLFVDSIVAAADTAIAACFAVVTSCERSVAVRDSIIARQSDTIDLYEARDVARLEEIDALEDAVPSFIDKLGSHALVGVVGVVVGALLAFFAGS